jgi:hypothetical protein
VSRRRKPSQARSKPHQHSASCTCGQTPQGPECWPTGQQIADVLDLGPVASAALGQLTASDVLELMQRIPPQFRQLMLRHLGLMSVTRINRGMAGQVLARIRSEANPAASSLLHMLTQPITNLLDEPLTVGEWTAIIGSDPAAATRALFDHPEILDLASVAFIRMNPLLRTAGLTAAISDNTPGAAVALAILAADNDMCADAHAQLSEQYPEMPPVVRGDVKDLSPLARLRATLPEELTEQLMGTDPDDTDAMRALLLEHQDTLEAALPSRSADASGPDETVNQDFDDLDDAGVSQDEAGDPSDLRTFGNPTLTDAQLDELLLAHYTDYSADPADPASDPEPGTPQGRRQVIEVVAGGIDATLQEWPDIAVTAETITQALQLGSLWDGDQVDVITEFESRVRLAARAAAALLSRPIQPTADGLNEAVAALTAALQVTDQAWLRSLTQLQAPSAVAAAAQAARELAAAALDGSAAAAAQDIPLPALEALHTIVTAGMSRRAGNDRVNYTEIAAADELVRELLPAVVPLLVPAGYGAVTVPDDVMEEVPDEVSAATHAADSPAADSAESSTSIDASDTGSDDSSDDEAAASTADADAVTSQEQVTAAAAAQLTQDTTSHDVAVPEQTAQDQHGQDQTRQHTDAQDAAVTPATVADATPPTEPHSASTTDGNTAAADANAPDSDASSDPDVDDEEAQLAAMLAGGAARTLSALTGALPRPSSAPTSSRTDEGTDTSTSTSAGSGAPSGTPTHVASVPTQKAPEPSLSPTDDADDSHGNACSRAQAAQPDLLSSGRFGLSADLLAACGHSSASIAARRGVAYATGLRKPTGELASAFSRVSTDLTRDELSDDRAGQLLAWACAARLAVLAPSAGPAGILTNLAPVIESSDALTEVGQALVEASRSGVVVLPETADAVGHLAAHELTAQSYADGARDLVTNAVTRAIKYVPANAVYQNWMHAEGALGKLLRLVAAGAPDTVADVRDMVVQMRGNADKAIDTTRAEVRRKHHKENKIVAGARTTLIARYDEAIEVASNWAEASERATETSRLQAGAWQAGPLHKLRQRLQTVRQNALKDLASLHPASPIDPADHTSLEIAAAAAVATALLTETFSICDGKAPTGDEPPATYTAHHELLASDLPLNAQTLLPDDGLTADHLPALLTLARNAPTDPEIVYAHRADRGDHDLTGALIAGLRATDPRTAQTLERRRTTDVGDDLTATTTEIDQLVSAIDTQRMAGGLDDGPYSTLSARAEALRPTKRNDFGRIRAEAEQIRTELTAHQKSKSDHAIARINERASNDQAVAAIADQLISLSKDGYIASAEEFLAQRQLPTARGTVDHLRQFFPAVPDLYATNGDLHSQLVQAFTDGQPTPTVTALATLAGTEFSSLSELRIDAGRRALRSWDGLQPGRNPKVDLAGLLRPLLTQAGLEFTDASLDPSPGRAPGGRQWITLTGVTGTGDALVPLVGSAISPHGNSLRVLIVRQAQSPSTVLEWMSGEPSDRTVLALWMGKPLTAADRRRLADAARGRPTPPVLWLDTAALGYLTCQTEPRRSTFAATTLPLTAVSPFRDKAGAAPVEMFYGRTDEMSEVLDLQGPSIVYGGRQLGKSALLRSAAERFENRGPDRVAVLESIFTVGAEDTDRDPSRLWDMLWPRLAARGIVPETVPTDGDLAEAVHDHIVAWTSHADSDRALLVLLDEADVFLDADAANNRFTQVDWCRRITADSQWRAKFVFAGLHRTARFESLPNQPLSHLGKPISIGPLKPQHAFDLLTEPLHAMGFRFADAIAGPARVLALANNMPALLQLFGRALIEHLTARPVDPDGPPSLITDDDIVAVFAKPDLRKQFEDKYQLTLRLDHRYMVIAYVVAEAAYDHGISTSLSLTEMLSACRAAWPAGFGGMSTDDFRGLVTECADLSVLAEDDGRFRIRTPTVLRLLGTEEHVLDVLYNRIEDLRVPSPTDASSYRRSLSASNARSPFTERQLGQLFTPVNRVVVVTGSNALGAHRAATALVEAREAAGNRIGGFRRCSTLTADGIRSSLGQLTGKNAMLLVDALKVSPAVLRELLNTCEHEIGLAAAGRRTTVVVIAGAHNAPAWVDWPHRLELLRVDSPGLRLWSDEANLPFHDDEAIARFRDATGGWPHVITRMSAKFSDRHNVTDEQVLTEARRWLAGSAGAKDLAVAAELTDGILASAFTSLATLTASGGEDLDSLAELLELDGMEPEQARAAGYSDLTDVVIALRALGCLVSDERGRLCAEPALAAAVQTTTAALTGAGAQ